MMHRIRRSMLVQSTLESDGVFDNRLLVALGSASAGSKDTFLFPAQ